MKTLTNDIEIIEVLLEWGKTHLITPVFNEHLEELEQYFNQLRKETNNFNELFLAYIKEMEVQVDAAMNALSNPEVINTFDGDDLWAEAEESFYTLDKVNYLKEAMYNLLSEEDRKNLNEFFKKLEKIETKIITRLHDSDFSPFRLSVFNDLRQSYLKEIPEEKQYLFPWYYLFSDYNENTIRTLIENFDMFLNKKKPVPKELNPYLNEITYELKRDKELLSIIKKEYVLHKNLFETFTKRSAVKLLYISEEAATNYAVSDHLEKVGLVRAAVKLVLDNKPPVMNKRYTAYWLFLSAFCGPKLKDAQRLETLEKVERILETIDTEKLEEEAAEILHPLKRWFNGEIEDQWLTKISFTKWKNLLELKAAPMPEMEWDENPALFWNTLSSLDPTIIDKLKEVILEWVGGEVINPNPSFEQPIAITSGEGDKGSLLVSLKNNPISLSLFPNSEGEYPILTPPSSGNVSTTVIKDYRELYDKIDRVVGFCWAGYFTGIDNIVETTEPTAIIKKIFTRIPANKYSGAVIGISDNREQLNQFIEQLKQSTDNVKPLLKEGTFNKIVVLMIRFEKRSLQ